MKFTIQTSELNQALQNTLSVIEKKNTVPILSNFLLRVSDQQLFVISTNLEVGMKISCEIQNSSSGEVTVPAKYFSDIIKDISEKEVCVSRKDNHWIEVTSGKYKVNIVGLPGEDYPALPSFEGREYFLVRSESMKRMIDKTSFAVSNDSTRYHLNGVFFEPLENSIFRMTATDGHRLSIVDEEVFLKSPQLKRGVIIPRKGLQELRKILDTSEEQIEMSLDRQYIFCKSKAISLLIRLIDGEYPDYRQVIPKTFENKVQVDQSILFSAIRRVSHLANEKSRAIRFLIQRGVIQISSSNPEMGDAKEEVEAEYLGPEMDIAFNSKYLMDYLAVSDCSKIELFVKDRMSPGILQGEGRKNQTYVIMPMRI
mgnify:CR=1 FL=1